MDAGRTFAPVATALVASAHGIHVGRGTSQIRQIAFKVRLLDNRLHFPEYAFLAPAHDELSLMGGYRTERTSAETSTMDIDRELDHVVCGNTFPLVFRMGHAGIRQVE